jgi:endogenous inhibitor of DNA gyrase (YacG/DUF329 family)
MKPSGSTRDSGLKAPPVVACPTCERAVEFTATNRFRPFCSARCRAIDLGAWASEQYAIPVRAPSEHELDDGAIDRSP